MKRKICESLFAVTLALTVAVTNIPVTAFATEINQSTRQEQTTENTQNGNEPSGDESENQGQITNGSQENQGEQNGSNAGNGQDKSDNSNGTNQNTGVSDNTESEIEKDAQSDGNNSQTEQVGKKANNSAAEAGISGQQNTDADQQNAQTSEQTAVLSSNGNVWSLHKGEITKSQLKSDLGDSNGTYRWRKKGTSDWKYTATSSSTIRFDEGIYEFQRNYWGWKSCGEIMMSILTLQERTMVEFWLIIV